MCETGLSALNEVIIGPSIRVTNWEINRDRYESPFFSRLEFPWLICRQPSTIQKVTPMPLSPAYPVEKRVWRIFSAWANIIDSLNRSVRSTRNQNELTNRQRSASAKHPSDSLFRSATKLLVCNRWRQRTASRYCLWTGLLRSSDTKDTSSCTVSPAPWSIGEERRRDCWRRRWFQAWIALHRVECEHWEVNLAIVEDLRGHSCLSQARRSTDKHLPVFSNRSKPCSIWYGKILSCTGWVIGIYSASCSGPSMTNPRWNESVRTWNSLWFPWRFERSSLRRSKAVCKDDR